MAEIKKENQGTKIKFDICSFKVPVKIIEVGEEEDKENQASFEEVEMKDLCFQIETIETETADEAQTKAKEIAAQNERTLKIAKSMKKTGDMVTRKIMCKHGSVTINESINNK
jgi:uncharacterized protein (DUF2344 family)